MIVYAHPASSRGALRAIVTTREAGMRWPRFAAACLRMRGRTAARGREVAWSWRPDAGAKFVTVLAHLTGDGGYKPGTPRRARISVKTIAQGMPVIGCTCGTCRLHFLRRRAMGEAFTRHSLRPPPYQEGHVERIPRASSAARTTIYAHCCLRCKSDVSTSSSRARRERASASWRRPGTHTLRRT